LRGDDSEAQPLKMDRGDDDENDAEVVVPEVAKRASAVEASAEVVKEKDEEGVAEEAHA